MCDLRTATDKILKYGITEPRIYEARLALDNAEQVIGEWVESEVGP